MQCTRRIFSIDLPPLPLQGEGWGEGTCTTNHYQNHSCSRTIDVGYSNKTHHPNRPPNCKDTRNMSLTRVCQPSPVSRSAARTSASKRNVATCLAPGLTEPTGLPRFFASTLATHSGRVTSWFPIMGVAVLNHCLSSSGASSGSTHSLFKVIDFSLMCIPHRNDAAGHAARRPNQYHPSTVQATVADETLFAVLKPLIFSDKPFLV